MLAVALLVVGALAIIGCRKMAESMKFRGIVNPDLKLERFLPYSSKEQVVHFTQTNDGKVIALHRTEPNFINKNISPLILCHGEGFNKWIWDIGRKESFVAYFANYGYDVWLLEFRGHGESAKPEWYNTEGYNWNFDDYIHRDLPAAISYVQEVTNSRQVTLVGHGTGGMAIYGFLETENFFDEVANAVLIAPPAFGNKATERLKELFSHVEKWDRRSPFELASLAMSDEKDPIFDELLFNATPILGITKKRFFNKGFENVAPEVLEQILYWSEVEDFLSSDLGFSYRNKLTLVKIPILVIAGDLDQFAAAGVVNWGYRVIPSSDKTLVVIGKRYGFVDDYGHLGLIMGRGCKEEVYPLIFGWLEDRTPKFDAWGKL